MAASTNNAPIGTSGDTYDRYLVRMEEMRQSVRMIHQCLDQLPGGPVNIADGKIVLSYKPNNEEGHKRLSAKLKELLQQQTKCGVHGHDCHEGLFARNLFVGQRIPLAGVAHQVGTLRFGHDPKSSVLDANCKAHDLDNLYVVDASFFVSSSAVNPSLTIIANALRVGEHLLDRLQ